jgi:hypothetical protein
MITDPLDRLLETTAGSADITAPSVALSTALEDMAVQIKRTPYPWRRRRRRVLVAAAISGSLVLAAPAAAGWVSARTGWFGSPGMTENDASEFLRQDSPEMAAIVENHGRDYPLPPGGSYAGVVERLRRDNGERGPGLIQDTGVRAMVAWESVCQWEGLWLSADSAGETDRRREAGIVLEEAATWPIFAQVDGGGVVELRRRVGADAAEGRRAAVEQDFRANCAGRDSQAGR